MQTTIDIAQVAQEMKRRGIAIETMAGWSDALLDVLEDLYNLESFVKKEMEKSQESTNPHAERRL